MLNKILKSLIYTIVFLVPIFFLPFTFEFLEFNKLYLLFFLSWLAVLVWFLKMIVKDKEVKIKYSKIDYIILALVVVSAISTIFSIDRMSSLFGYYGRFSTGFISLITFAGFYFMIKNQKLNIEKIIKTLLVSTGFILLFPYLRLLGFWRLLQGTSVIKFLALRVSTLGATAESLVIYLAIMMFLSIFVILGGIKWSGFSKDDVHKKWKIYSGILIFLSFILFLIADFAPAWIVLGISLLLLVFSALKTKVLKNEVHRLILPIALIILSALFLSLNVKVLVTNTFKSNADNYYSFMPERVLTQAESWTVSGRSVVSGPKEAILGVGPGNFYYSFSKFRPLSLNRGDLWAVRFDRSNVLAETLSTTGILGFLLYIGLLVVAILYFLPKGRKFIKYKKGKLDHGSSVLLIILISLILIQVLYYQTLSLGFLFWLFLGIGIAWIAYMNEGVEKTLEAKSKATTEITLLAETILIIFCIIYMVVGFYMVKFYIADMNYVQALNNPDLDQKVIKLSQAIRLNPSQTRYQLVLSRVFLSKAQSSSAEQDITRNISSAISWAARTTEITPKQIGGWQSLSDIYQNAASISTDSDQFITFAIEFMEKSIEIEPKNPEFYTEIGNMHLLLGDEDLAIEYWNKAVEQKYNYDQANINLALLLERNGDMAAAIEKLEWLFSINPNSAEVSFQLGRLYYNDDQIDEAVSQLLIAVTLNPRYSNALYALGLALERQGNIDEAITALEAVLILNPESKEIEDRITRLKFGTSEPEVEIEE